MSVRQRTKQSCQQSGQYTSLIILRRVVALQQRLRSHHAYQLREQLDQLGARSFCSTLFMFIPHLCQALLTPPKPVKPLPTTRLLRQRPCPCPAAD